MCIACEELYPLTVPCILPLALNNVKLRFEFEFEFIVRAPSKFASLDF